MRKQQSIVANDLASAVDDLYGKFGLLTMAIALAMAAWRRRVRSSNSIADLDSHMRRDIGLPDADHPSSPPKFPVWSMRP
ncbi:DUF1127 domain-containing protein [Neorhizobium sp. DAR64860/K0K1]|uniref:DUF1127 domain-containing protein n=1 Tax=Neorhizobium sp. DAR64860/K0K1 TaxID=3421955 RepID=UPI003D269E5F